MPVPAGGYVWWYLDALSDDGAFGLTVIAFVGSVFSPYYAHARNRRARNGLPPPYALDHCTVNVALYGPRIGRWAMTERGRRQVERSATRLTIGPSALEWVDGSLRLHLDEVTTPLPSRIRGAVDVVLGSRPDHSVALDAEGHHRWGVIAPCARVAVALDAPRLAWSGRGYVDSNRGSVPLEHDFVRWDWSRGHLADGRTAVVYDLERRRDVPLAIADCFAVDGTVQSFVPPPLVALPDTRWGLRRSTRSATSMPPSVVSRFEDGPFYSRSVVDAEWLGEPVRTVHEHVSLRRFEQRWVRTLLPFRMPRRYRGTD